MKRTTYPSLGLIVRSSCATLAIVVVIFGLGEPTRGQHGGRTVRLVQVTELPASAKRFALVIGVDDYEDPQITPLAGAGNDASALAAALVDYAGFPRDQVFLLASFSKERPTRGNILRRLSNLRGVVPKDGLLLVAFSGHGIDRAGRGFLIPSDAQALGDVDLLEETAVSVDSVREKILATGVGQVIFIVDACRNDPVAGKGDSDNPMSAAFSRGFSFDVANREVRAFATLYATEVGHRAYEDHNRKRGYFSEALVEGISGKAANARGEVTLSALVSYLESTVPRRIALYFGAGKRQLPSARIELYRAAELIISKVAPVAVPVPAPVVDPKAGELALWNTIESSREIADFEDYLKRYPTGTYEGAARAKIRILRAAPTPVELAPVRPAPGGGGIALPAATMTSGHQLARTSIAALGGEAWLRQTSLVASGTGRMWQDSLAVEIPSVQYWEDLPDNTRIELDLGIARTIYWVNAEGSWLDQGDGPRDISAQSIDKKYFGFSVLRRFGQGENLAIRPLADGEVNGVKTRGFAISDAAGHSTEFHVDAATSLVVRVRYRSHEGPTELHILEWREVDGLKLALRTVQYRNGQKFLEVTLTDVKSNVEVDKALFESPRIFRRR